MEMPTVKQLYKPVLNELADSQVQNIKVIRDKLAQKFMLTEEQLSERLKSGRLLFNTRVSWTCTYLFKAGAVERPIMGDYRITELGKKLLLEETITTATLLEFDSFREFKNRESKETTSGNVEPDNTEAPEEVIQKQVELLDEALADELLEKILSQSPFYFERIVLRLLNKMGYGDEKITEPTQKTGDGGIDGIINEDPLGLHKIYVQAKRWDLGNVVGRPEIQKFKGAMDDRYEGLSQGVFITTSSFSSGAREYANNLKLAKIILIDGQELAKLMIHHGVGVSPKTTIVINDIDLDFFNEDE